MKLQLHNRDAFHAVWEALNQYVANQVAVDDRSAWPAEVQARVREAEALIERMDTHFVAQGGNVL